MDDLRAEFARLKSRKDSRRLAELRRFQEKLGRMRFFDPACGCGNFLIIAYRELRTLEIDVLKEVHPKSPAGRQTDALAETLSRIDVDQFYGIELGEFPARIAETAMWMMDHIMNNRLSLEFGQTYARIPLRTSPHYHARRRAGSRLDGIAAAGRMLLRVRQSAVRGREVPDGGPARVRCAGSWGSARAGGTLDYVDRVVHQGRRVCEGLAACGSASSRPTRSRRANRSRNSGRSCSTVLQAGDRVRAPHLRMGIGRAGQGACARRHSRPRPAQEHARPAEKRLFSYPDINGDPEESRHAALSPYLFDAGGLSDPHLVVRGGKRADQR